MATSLQYYRNLLNGYKKKVATELSSDEAAAVLRFYDCGVSALDKETVDLIYSVAAKLKGQIWP